MDKLFPIVSLISGVTFTELRQVSDERGALLHMLRCDAAEFSRFGECYFSEVLPGAIKAWKRHRMQTQNLAVPVGRIRMVIYDNREGSVTRGQLQELQLGRPMPICGCRFPQVFGMASRASVMRQRCWRTVRIFPMIQ